jgi:hypothetical protein
MGPVVAAATLWALFSAWLGLPHLGARERLTRTVGVLFWAEFVALVWWADGGGPVAHAVAFVDVPLLTAAVVGTGAVDGLRRRRA